MKKTKYLLIFPALFCSCLTSCGNGPLVGTSKDFNNVIAAAEKVANSNTEKINTIEYYSVKQVKETFETPKDLVEDDVKNIGYRLVEEERLTRIDFDPNNYFYYDFNKITYTYYKGFIATGSVEIEKLSLYEGYQFYKKDGIYHFEYWNREMLQPATSFFLENHPEVTATADLLRVEDALETNGKGELSDADGKVAFELFFNEIAEADYKIDSFSIQEFENDGTKDYEYYGSDTSFSIVCDKKMDIQYQEPIASSEDEKGNKTYEPYSAKVIDPSLRRGQVNYAASNGKWLDTETKTATGTRRVNMQYGRNGWLSHGVVQDQRTEFLYDLIEGSSSIIVSYYLTADFNKPLTHAVGE